MLLFDNVSSVLICIIFFDFKYKKEKNQTLKKEIFSFSFFEHLFEWLHIHLPPVAMSRLLD